MIGDRYIQILVACTALAVGGLAMFRPEPAGPGPEKGEVHGPHHTAVAGSAAGTHSSSPRPAGNGAPLRREGPFTVEKVLDGDTLRLDDGRTVRLIGVDAPEKSHPEIPVQRFAEEATEFLRRQVEGFEVEIEVDPAEKTDRYGRTLAYIWRRGTLVNAELIRRGYAYAYTRFPHPRADAFVEIERQAQEDQAGLWHLSLRDGRIANLVHRYESLSLEGRRELDRLLDDLVREHPYNPPDEGAGSGEGER